MEKDIEIIKSQLKGILGDFTKLVIIGLGSEIRGDDSVGLYIANKLLEAIKDPRVHIMIGGTTPENLTGPIRKIKPSHVLLVDAANAKKTPGDLFLIDPKDVEGMDFSTHTFSLSAFSEYVSSTIGSKVLILGIQPSNMDLSEGLSRETEHAAEHALDIIKNAIC